MTFFENLKSEQGVSMLEMALITPLILLFVAGIIDYGSTIRRIEQLSTAAKSGARYAASQSVLNSQANSNNNLLCNNPTGNLDGRSCNAILAGPFADSVEYFGKWAACDSLNSAGLNINEWNVGVAVRMGSNASLLLPASGSHAPNGRVVRVAVSRAANASRDCFLCVGDFFRGGATAADSEQFGVLSSSSTYAVEGRCACPAGASCAGSV